MPLVGELLERRVLQVAHPETEDGEVDLGLRLGFDEAHELALVGDPDVEITVGGEDHPVAAAGDELLLRNPVGELDPLPAVGRAAGGEALDRVEDAVAPAPRGGR